MMDDIITRIRLVLDAIIEAGGRRWLASSTL